MKCEGECEGFPVFHYETIKQLSVSITKLVKANEKILVHAEYEDLRLPEENWGT